MSCGLLRSVSCGFQADRNGVNTGSDVAGGFKSFGGFVVVAIHTIHQVGRDLLLDRLPEESFGGGIKHLPKYKCSDTVFVKGVSTSVSTQEFARVLKDSGIYTIDVRRLTNRGTGKPIRVLRVKCMQQFAGVLLNSKIRVDNSECVVEKERRTRVIRCCKCQRFGHLAKFCKKKSESV